MIEATLPHNLEAERSCIGALLLGGEVTDGQLQRLKPSDFFLPQHQIIWKHILRLRAGSKPIDLVILCDSLNGELEAAGGYPYFEPDCRQFAQADEL